MVSSSRSVIFDMAETTIGHRTLRAASRGRKLRRRAHAFGRADAGAAEFHDQQVVQLKSFPLVMRERTSFKMASSTSSMPRPVESR